MKHYADSSFLVSCYVADQNTAVAKAWLSQSRVALPFTALHALEVQNAFQLGVFRGMLARAEVASAIGDLESDVRAGRLIQTSINWENTLRTAAAFSGKYTAVTGVRSLDILHIAAARSLRAVELVSFDARQRSLATAIGLTTSP